MKRWFITKSGRTTRQVNLGYFMGPRCFWSEPSRTALAHAIWNLQQSWRFLQLPPKTFLNVGSYFCKPQGSNCEGTEERRYLVFIPFRAMIVIRSTVDRLNVSFARVWKSTKRLFSFFKKKENSTLFEHACVTNHEIAWENSKIITTNSHYHQRRCLEAWHINSAHATLNRDDGGLLPEAYLHLVNRWCHHRSLRV